MHLQQRSSSLPYTVEQILGTNFIVPRKWYCYDELIKLGKQYKEREGDWNAVIEELVNAHKYCQSPMEQVPNDIWSFAKMRCLAESDDALEEWFQKDIPALVIFHQYKYLKWRIEVIYYVFSCIIFQLNKISIHIS